MSTIGAAPRAAVPLSPARAEASRRNGARSRGPKTAEGKARAAQNALKHGFRAQAHIVLPSEDAAEFAALEAALMEELAPDGALQAALAQRVVSAVWRLGRAERLEAELFAENQLAGRSLGLALIRDGNGARSFDTLLRYRGTATAELWRALRTLKALQAEQAEAPRPMRAPEKNAGALAVAPATPSEPEARRIALQSTPAPPAEEPSAATDRGTDRPRLTADEARAQPACSAPADPGIARKNPIEPEAPAIPGEIGPTPLAGKPRGARGCREGGDADRPGAAAPAATALRPDGRGVAARVCGPWRA
jgi:hypothetical protein